MQDFLDAGSPVREAEFAGAALSTQSTRAPLDWVRKSSESDSSGPWSLRAPSTFSAGPDDDLLHSLGPRILTVEWPLTNAWPLDPDGQPWIREDRGREQSVEDSLLWPISLSSSGRSNITEQPRSRRGQIAELA